jgi:hypothetical protein
MRPLRLLLPVLVTAALWPAGIAVAAPVTVAQPLTPIADLQGAQGEDQPQTQLPGDEERGTDIPDEDDSPEDASPTPSTPRSTPSTHTSARTASPALPRTGVDALPLAALGLLLLAGGLRLRRSVV